MIKQSGFSLLEVLVALIVFSIGLLGLAGLQSAGIRNNQVSYARTVAIQLTYDMADRIRNNPNADYATASTSSTDDCVGGSCSSTQLAGFDRTEWENAITDPNGPLKNSKGFIEQATPTDPFVISIGWDDSGVGSPATDCTPPTPAGISCVTIEVRP